MHMGFIAVCCWIGTLQPEVRGQTASEALDKLRGRGIYSPAELRNMITNAQPGTAYPTLGTIPQTSFSCDKMAQGGFYADSETQCQVYHRCDPSTPMSSYICPNGTLFSQVALTCDYWYNVQCSQSDQFENYSNSRLFAGPNIRLLDDVNSTSTSGS